MQQVGDIAHTITYLQQGPDVDPDKGVSFGGSTAVYAAAIDRRARWVVEISGPADGERSHKNKRTY